MLALILGGSAQADILVIVNPARGEISLEQKDVSRVFLGKSKSLPNGVPVIAIDQDSESNVRARFSQKVLLKSQIQLKAYWSRMIFTGKGNPPDAVGGDQEVIALIQSNPNMIGYIDKSSHTDDVRVVYVVKE